MAVIDAIRFARDFGQTANCFIGKNSYIVNLIVVSSDQIGVFDNNNARLVSSQRITIGDSSTFPDGYNKSLPNDGYANPFVEVIGGSIAVLGSGQLTMSKLKVGPLVYPYNLGFATGGYDPISDFSPPDGSATNIQVYFQVLGVGLAASANIFKLSSIILATRATEGEPNEHLQEGVSYKLLLESTGINVNLG
jgi:hypothetical protein